MHSNHIDHKTMWLMLQREYMWKFNFLTTLLWYNAVKFVLPFLFSFAGLNFIVWMLTKFLKIWWSEGTFLSVNHWLSLSFFFSALSLYHILVVQLQLLYMCFLSFMFSLSFFFFSLLMDLILLGILQKMPTIQVGIDFHIYVILNWNVSYDKEK